jgi:hypothetical protein
MNDKQRGYLAAIIIIIVLLVLGFGGLYLYNRITSPVNPTTVTATSTNNGQPQYASNCGLNIESPAAHSPVSFPLTVSGTIVNTVTNGCGWTMFEGQGGKAELLYETKDGWSLPVDTQPIKVADWTATSTTFNTTLNFDNKTEDFPSGYNFKVILTEEDPSGTGTPDTIELPLTLK